LSVLADRFLPSKQQIILVNASFQPKRYDFGDSLQPTDSCARKPNLVHNPRLRNSNMKVAALHVICLSVVAMVQCMYALFWSERLCVMSNSHTIQRQAVKYYKYIFVYLNRFFYGEVIVGSNTLVHCYALYVPSHNLIWQLKLNIKILKQPLITHLIFSDVSKAAAVFLELLFAVLR